MHNCLKYTLFLMLTAFSAGCLNIERTINFNLNGSGTEKISIILEREAIFNLISTISALDSSAGKEFADTIYNNAAFVEETKLKHADTEGMRILNVSAATTPDSSKEFFVEFEFDDIKMIHKSGDKLTDEETNDSTYHIEWTEFTDSIRFVYEFKMKVDEGTIFQNEEAMNEMFMGDTLTYNLTFPYGVLYGNYDYQTGNIYTWKFSISEASKAPVMIKAVIRKY